MQKAGLFFFAVLLGGVLSAACGFDLFREDRGGDARTEIAGLERRLRDREELLGRSEILLKELEQRNDALRTQLAAAPVPPAPPGPGAAELRAEASRAIAESTRARGESQAQQARIRELEGSLALVRAREQALGDAVKSLRGAILDLARRVFTRERDEADAALAAYCLQALDSKEDKQTFFIHLIAHNKKLLPALGLEAEGGIGAAEGQVAPAALRTAEGSSRP